MAIVVSHTRVWIALLFACAPGAGVLVACGARTGIGGGGDGPIDASIPDSSKFTDARIADNARPMDVLLPDGACAIGLDATFTATIRITTDDNFRLFVNGTLIDDTPRVWTEVQTYSVQLFQHPSKRNTIAIEGTNVENTSGPDRGIIADTRFAFGSIEDMVVTNTSWRLSTSLESGWTEVGFDASGWRFALSEGPHGMAPWGALLGQSSAEWLWSYDSNQPADAKVVGETVYVRRDFYIDRTGHVSDVPQACP
jgi:hypothetical protein